jgi:hypothetical protein
MSYSHGMSGTSLYKRCALIKDRCTNHKSPSYKNYGGRGITLYKEWQNDYSKMIDYILSIGYNDELTIDRIDNDGNYEPGNLRMATRSEQQQNKRPRKDAPISACDVSEIKSMLRTGDIPQVGISRLFNVSRQCITDIKQGNRWRNVK